MLGFTDALRKGRAARDAFARLAPPPPNAKEATLKVWFGQAQMLVDQASRMYAGAFNAKDATREGRIDAIAEAAELDMTMARTLDEQNLGSMPAAWRSDPAVAGTFEDVEVGPTRRWRAEARVLTRQCIDTARESNVVTDAARRCAALRTGVPVKVARQAPDAGAGCACSPGDPLCSASLGGWCGSFGALALQRWPRSAVRSSTKISTTTMISSSCARETSTSPFKSSYAREMSASLASTLSRHSGTR